ncbi:carbonic anhydrase [Helicobacter cappadocius]|uniref:carbonic anhydrase n=1 Tax=Helicobacter cappadocius TaxID=3063998 RepID=A0AA90PJC7_9HELI|nr:MULTISPECIES: carbonic anhydrase family protein [unclassified Helicobacter]MDO7252707.1 carbonic anhydrase family protein [Helicobacter sp. faydin-H75]MDP2538575.1 carbonic anhydrase family protein [Helicobacter sp. faydin-H76]
MKKIALCLGVALVFSSVAFANGPKWDYEGKNSPQNWGKISKDFDTCSLGKSQSPVNITNFTETKMPYKIIFSYKAFPKLEVDDGRTIRVEYNKDAYVSIDGHRYYLTQFHFHSPAENLLKNKQYPLEMHLVHQDKDGHLLVVAIWFKEGKDNKILDPVWKAMPQKVGEKIKVSNVDLGKLIPKKLDFFHYDGSLTTPPCTEGVSWFILKEPLEVSKDQIKKIQQTLKESNNRPVQPLNNRKVELYIQQ